jgi:Ion channel
VRATTPAEEFDIEAASLFDLLTRSVYFASATLATLGYGDYAAQNFTEVGSHLVNVVRLFGSELPWSARIRMCFVDDSVDSDHPWSARISMYFVDDSVGSDHPWSARISMCFVDDSVDCDHPHRADILHVSHGQHNGVHSERRWCSNPVHRQNGQRPTFHVAGATRQ